ncbi:MAG: hypothetical protein J5603_01335, partial [Bacteroidales bacterium]|nr:hypothetical protein [Bacteroidales bacterium]
MGKHKLLKRAAAGLLAASLVLVGIPKVTGGLLTKSPTLKASAGEIYLGNPLAFWPTCEFNADETFNADIDIMSGSVIKIGNEKACNVTVNGLMSVGEDAELHLYNGSYLFLNGDLTLYEGCKIICDDNSKVIFGDATVYLKSENVQYNSNDLIWNATENLWNNSTFSTSTTIDGNVTAVNGSTIKISGKSLVTVNGSLDLRSTNLEIEDDSYLFVKGGVRLSSKTNVTCNGNAKILLYTTSNMVPVTVSSSAVYNINDFVGTNLESLTYIPDLIPSKNYFKSNGTNYTFDDTQFTEIKDNSTTLSLKELCTYKSQEASFDRQIQFSKAARDAFDKAYSANDKELYTELVGYMIDGDTCSDLHIPADIYRRVGYRNYFLTRFNQTAGYGTTYIVTAEEATQLPVSTPKFSSERMNVGFDLTLLLEFSNIDTETIDDFSVILTGSCAEAGKEQKITYNTDTNLYCVKATVPVNHMSDTITGQVYYKGKEVGDPFTTNVEEYLEKLSAQQSVVKDIADAILVYGKAATNYFSDEKYDISSEIASYRNKYNLKDADDVARNFPEKLIPQYQPSDAKVSMVLDTTVTLRCYLSIMKYFQVGEEFGKTGYILEEDENGRYISLSGLRPFDMFNTVANFKVNGVVHNCSCCAWVYRVL